MGKYIAAGKILLAHAPQGAFPPADMIEHLMAGRNATILWIEDHGWQGWQMIDKPQFCTDCGDELVAKGGELKGRGTERYHYNYTCPTCGEVYF